MQSFTRTKKILCLTFAVLMVLFSFVGCGTGNDVKTHTTLDELNDAKIGVVTGTVFSVLADELIPKAEKIEFNSASDALMALDNGIQGLRLDFSLKV